MFHHAGAGKKKSLIEPVSIIPFPNQKLRDKVLSVPKKIIAQSPLPENTAATHPRTTVTTTGQLNTNSISIKKMLEKVEEEQIHISNHENLPKESYSFDHFKMLWRRYAFEVKEKGMETFYNALIKKDPLTRNNHQYILEVDNQVQVDYITPQLLDMVTYLRKELKNYLIEVTIELGIPSEKESKFLTGKDKFALLARKNPNLHTLKNTFNLDIEF
jgi:hypothetical protein